MQKHDKEESVTSSALLQSSHEGDKSSVKTAAAADVVNYSTGLLVKIKRTPLVSEASQIIDSQSSAEEKIASFLAGVIPAGDLESASRNPGSALVPWICDSKDVSLDESIMRDTVQSLCRTSL